jgi:hypothetical protein
MTAASAALEELWQHAGGDPSVLEHVTLTGDDPILPTDFKIGTAASALIAATALAAGELWSQRTGRRQSVAVALRAAVAAFRSERYLRVNGEAPPDLRGDVFGFYRAGDGRWIQLHGALPHHRDGIVGFLGCASTRQAASRAVEKWNAAELEDALAKTEEFGAIVQELVPGGDDALYTVGSYLTREGDALGIFCGRKLRQTPPGIGTCRVGEAVWVQEVVDQGLRLLRALRHTGLSQVEFKRDQRDGSYRLMEVNPRLWQWHGLAAACGVDLPRIAFEDLTGERPDPVWMNGRRRRWAITLLPGERPAPQRPPYVDAVFARDDLKPALVQAARLLRR